MPRAFVLCLTLTACKAERLGVEVPKGGPETMTPEDLARDTFALDDKAFRDDRSVGSPGGEEARMRFEQRLQQMHTLPAFGSAYRGEDGVVCGQKDGRSGKTVVIAGIDEGRGAATGAIPWAAVISLAKAWDVPSPPTDTLVFCGWSDDGGAAYAAKPAAPLDATRLIVTIGPLADGPLELTASDRLLGGSMVPHLAVSAASRSATQDGMADVDLRETAEHLRAVHARVEGR